MSLHRLCVSYRGLASVLSTGHSLDVSPLDDAEKEVLQIGSQSPKEKQCIELALTRSALLSASTGDRRGLASPGALTLLRRPALEPRVYLAMATSKSSGGTAEGGVCRGASAAGSTASVGLDDGGSAVSRVGAVSFALWNLTLTSLLTPCSSIVTP